MSAVELFNPAARFESVRFSNGGGCLVVDNALADPGRLLQYAADNRAAFTAVDFSAYPGISLGAPQSLAAALAEFFNLKVRRHFDARRLVQMQCRLSMVTLAPAQLHPTQCLPHRDQPTLDPGLSIQACILYLFRDAELGGTGFYDSARAADELDALSRDAQSLPSTEFFARYGLAPGYLTDSNAWFTRVGGVEARWNRCIFFDGFALHSGDIRQPQRLAADPLTGRLTCNGFFTSRRPLR
jgi:uncharacterized protein DUF6445